MSPMIYERPLETEIGTPSQKPRHSLITLWGRLPSPPKISALELLTHPEETKSIPTNINRPDFVLHKHRSQGSEQDQHSDINSFVKKSATSSATLENHESE